MEQSGKKVKDLTLEEASTAVDELVLRKKRIDVTIAGLKENKNKYKSEKREISEAKKKS